MADVTLDSAIASALTGKRGDLYGFLSRVSGLPGVRANLPLARTFAQACAADARGAMLATSLATLSADDAPGDTALEFLPLCGVLAAGAVASRQPKARRAMIAIVHDAAEDMRFRVRDAAAEALVYLGAREGSPLLLELHEFQEGYFHAAAVLRALADREFVARLGDDVGAVEFVTASFELAANAPRAAARYPGYKALLEALANAIEPLALRLGAPMFDALVTFAKNKDPVLRDLVRKAAAAHKLRARFGDEVRRVEAAFGATDKPIRDPRSLPRPTRKRGGKRQR